MIDLDKLDKEIDKLFETETSDSLTKWLLNKRFGNINVLLGNGSFVNMSTQKQAFFSNKSRAVFNKGNNYSGNNPINRQAA
ncbi:MAG: hypothetical protein ABFS35_22885 [Bacteroidota bacterium]